MSQIDEDTLLEPEIIHEDDFADHCLEHYDVIKYGTKKARKKSAQRLVTYAVSLAKTLSATLNALHDLQKAVSVPVAGAKGSHTYPDSPWKGTSMDPPAGVDEPAADQTNWTPAPSDLDTTRAEAPRVYDWKKDPACREQEKAPDGR